MLKNAPTLAIVAVDTAENEPLKISLIHFIISILSLLHRGAKAQRADCSRVMDRRKSPSATSSEFWLRTCMNPGRKPVVFVQESM